MVTVSGLTINGAERQPDHNVTAKPKTTIGAIQDDPFWFLSPLQHRQLMTQRDDLGLGVSMAAKAGEKLTTIPLRSPGQLLFSPPKFGCRGSVPASLPTPPEKNRVRFS